MLREKVLAGLGELKADVVLKNCRIVNVNTKEINKGDIAIYSGFISGMGDVKELIGSNTEIIDLKNSYVCPGLIDAHVHFESSMLTLTNFVKCCVLHGTTSIVIDAHEIANVLGARGIKLVMHEAEKLPMDIFFTIPSCVPSSTFETSGAVLGIKEIKQFLEKRSVVGLGEVMSYSDVLDVRRDILGKISSALDKKLVVDGHAPGLKGKKLFGYMGAGISSDHESITYEEVIEKARLGMKIMLREGSAAKSLQDFIPKLLKEGISLENFFFATDDMHPEDLMKGHMDVIVRRAIRLGVAPIQAISMSTINTAKHYRIDHLVGSISIGRRANLIILDDLRDFRIKWVMVQGKINPIIEETRFPNYALRTLKYKKIMPEELKIKTSKDRVSAYVIEIIHNQLITKKSLEELKTENNVVKPDISKDVLYIAVIERHGKSRNIGLGFVRGFNLKEGAFGQSIAHDAHNVIIVGTNVEDMALCANELKKLQGGIVIAKEKVIESLHLPFAGILSINNLEYVNKKLKKLHDTIRNMGCMLDSPFIQLSFLSLPVIPSLKITDKGLIDVDTFRILPPLQESEET